MSGVGSRTISGTPSAFLILRRGGHLGAEVGDGGRHDDHVGLGGPAQHGGFHLGGGLDRDDLDARPDRAGHGGDEGDRGPPRRGGLLGDGVALLARRAVADEADRIDRLAGAAGGDEHAHAGQVPGSGASVDGGHDVGRLGQAAGPHVAAGQTADAGLDHVDAAAAQHRQVVLHGRVLPHLGVHGRADHHRAPGGQQRGREQVVGDAGRRRRR